MVEDAGLESASGKGLQSIVAMLDDRGTAQIASAGAAAAGRWMMPFAGRMLVMDEPLMVGVILPVALRSSILPADIFSGLYQQQQHYDYTRWVVDSSKTDRKKKQQKGNKSKLHQNCQFRYNNSEIGFNFLSLLLQNVYRLESERINNR